MKGYARPNYPALRAIHVMLFVKRLGDLYGLGLKDVLVDLLQGAAAQVLPQGVPRTAAAGAYLPLQGARRQVCYGCVVRQEAQVLQPVHRRAGLVQALAFYDTPNRPRRHMRVRVLYDMMTQHGARDPTIGAANQEEAMEALVRQSCAKEPMMLPRVSGSFLRGLTFGTCRCCGATPMHET